MTASETSKPLIDKAVKQCQYDELIIDEETDDA